MRTLKSHIDNMVTGVTTGFQYRLRFAYAHFPINVNLTNNDKIVEIRNYLGERRVSRGCAAAGRLLSRMPCCCVLQSTVHSSLILTAKPFSSPSFLLRCARLR